MVIAEEEEKMEKHSIEERTDRTHEKQKKSLLLKFYFEKLISKNAF